MWNTKVIRKTKQGTTLSVHVEFTKGAVVHVEEIFIASSHPDKWFESQINAKMKELDKIDELDKSIAIGAIDSSVAIVVPPAPTAQEIKEAEYRSKKEDLEIIKKELDLGIVKQKDYDTLLVEVIALKEAL